MSTASIPNTTGGRLTSYYEFQARQVKRAEVALDVIEFEVEEDTGIEVEEQQFDSMEELMEHVKQVIGDLS